jgi:hypothetical protein
MFIYGCTWVTAETTIMIVTRLLHATESNACKDLNVNIKTGTVAVSPHKDGSVSLATLRLNVCEQRNKNIGTFNLIIQLMQRMRPTVFYSPIYKLCIYFAVYSYTFIPIKMEM